MITFDFTEKKKMINKGFGRIKMYIYPVLKLQKIDENLVIFESYLGRNYNDNPKALYEYMKTKYPLMDYVWVVDKYSGIEIDEVRTINRLSMEYFLLIARAKYIINNSRMPSFFKKRDEQIYLQTWHGTPLKKLVFDMEANVMPGTTQEKYLIDFSKEVKNWSYLLSPNTYSSRVFRSAFDYDGEILEFGYPRNERLHRVTEKERQHLRSKFQIAENEKVVLYTPTYRDDNSVGRGKYAQDMLLNLKLLDKEPNLKVLIKTHYLISENLNLESYSNIIDVSKIQDINDLFIISDVLLTDYSSTMFDYLKLEKPLILFPYDLDDYKNKIRGFYIDYDSLPAEQINDTQRLLDIMNNLESYLDYWSTGLTELKKSLALNGEVNSCEYIITKLINKDK